MKQLLIILMLMSSLLSEELEGPNMSDVAAIAQETLQEAIKPQETSINYFEAFNPNDEQLYLQCPQLKLIYNSIYFRRVDYIDPRAGKIQCSVVDKFNPNSVVQTKSFSNDKVVDYFKSITVHESESVIQKDVLAVRQSYQDKIELNKMSTAPTAQAPQDNKEVNFVKLLTALAGMNNEIIDVKATIEQQNLTLANGHYLKDSYALNEQKSETFDFIRSTAKELFEKAGLEKLNPFDDPQEIEYEEVKSKAETIANDDVLFYISYLTRVNSFINDLLLLAIFAAIAWAGIYAIYTGYKDYNSKDETKDKLKKMILPALPLVAIGAGFGSFYDVAKIQTVHDEAVLTKTTFQNILSEIYMTSHDKANGLAKITIEEYLQTVNAQAGIDSIDVVKNNEHEKRRLEKENESLDAMANICANTYDTVQILSFYRNNDIEEKYKNNIYPQSEDTAKNMFLKAQTDQIKNSNNDDYIKQMYIKKLSIYNKDARIVRAEKFDDEERISGDIYSIEACHNIRAKQLSNLRQIQILENRIAQFNDVDTFFDKQEIIKSTHQIMWKMYDQYGYYSLSFLPVLKSVSDIAAIAVEKEKEYQRMLFDNDNLTEDLAKFASEQAAFLLLFDTSSVQSMIKAIATILTSWIPFFGNAAASTVTVISTMILVDIVLSVATILKTALFMVIAMGVFAMIFLQQLTTYLISPFAAVFALSQRKYEKITSIMVKVFYVSLKPILFIFAIALTFVAVSLLDVLYTAFMSDAKELLSATSGAVFSTISGSIMNAIFELFYFALQFVVIYYLLVTQPSLWFEFLDTRVQDLGQAVHDNVKQSAEKYLK